MPRRRPRPRRVTRENFCETGTWPGEDSSRRATQKQELHVTPGGYSSPRMNASTRARPSSSGSCTGGDFIRYDEAEMIGPPMPRSMAIFAARMASMMMPAELGESQTSSLYSMLSGTSPKARPSRRT